MCTCILESTPGDSKTVTKATSTETCEGRESSVDDENQLQHTLKRMLPAVIEEVITQLGSKMR